MSGLIDFLAAGLDAGGPEEVVGALDEMLSDGVVLFLDDVWRLDHPQLAAVLEAIGTHHPAAKAVAKAARKALMKHKSRSAARR